MHAPERTLISYATKPGNVASDGVNGDSPYTSALAGAIRRPGLDTFQVFNQTLPHAPDIETFDRSANGFTIFEMIKPGIADSDGDIWQ